MDSPERGLRYFTRKEARGPASRKGRGLEPCDLATPPEVQAVQAVQVVRVVPEVLRAVPAAAGRPEAPVVRTRQVVRGERTPQEPPVHPPSHA